MERELTELLRRQTDFHVTRISTIGRNQLESFPDFRQTEIDLHGSHMIFYWLRSRGQGVILRNDGAGLGLSWRSDVERFVVWRPVGKLEAIVELLNSLVKLTSAAWPGKTIVARYCGEILARHLMRQGWINPSHAWLPDMPFDDEDYPEIVVTTEPSNFPTGKQHNLLRKAINLHKDEYTYRASPKLLDCGEAEFVTTQAARADHYDKQEESFNSSLLSFLRTGYHTNLTYHYIFHEQVLCGFAITGNTTGISHVYYFGTIKTSRLSTYFQWRIYQEERESGAHALNLGGSETESLYTFKVRTFGENFIQRTRILQYPED